MTLAGQKLTTTLVPLTVTPRPLIGGLPGCSLQGRVFGGTLSCHGGQARQFSGGIQVRTADAVSPVEFDGQIESLVPLGQRRRRMLTAHLNWPHREAEHRPDQAVTVNGLDPGMTAMTPRQLDGLRVRPSHIDRFIELLRTHPTSTPEACDTNALRTTSRPRTTEPSATCQASQGGR